MKVKTYWTVRNQVTGEYHGKRYNIVGREYARHIPSEQEAFTQADKLWRETGHKWIVEQVWE